MNREKRKDDLMEEQRRKYEQRTEEENSKTWELRCRDWRRERRKKDGRMIMTILEKREKDI